MNFIKPVQIVLFGESGSGKSHIAASFVKEFDGIVLDISGTIQRAAGKGRTSEYTTQMYGHSAYACENVGIDFERQYKLICTWEDFEKAVDYAMAYRDELTQKPNKRIWVVVDDTSDLRWKAAIHQANVNKHASIAQDDWGGASTDMRIAFTKLAANFNVIYLCQMKDEMANKESTGKRVGAFYPPSMNHIVEVCGQWSVATNPKAHHFNIEKSNIDWDIMEEFPKTLVNPTPQSILESVRLNKNVW